ncbi:MAG: LuxR C-terminal-related transcriptional regulator [Xanthobacteraceae bacterium]
MNKDRRASRLAVTDPTQDCSPTSVLSTREREVMILIAKGLANKQIARQLDVSEGTVKLHLHNIYRKLGIKSRFALTALVRNAS